LGLLKKKLWTLTESPELLPLLERCDDPEGMIYEHFTVRRDSAWKSCLGKCFILFCVHLIIALILLAGAPGAVAAPIISTLVDKFFTEPKLDSYFLSTFKARSQAEHARALTMALTWVKVCG